MEMLKVSAKSKVPSLVGALTVVLCEQACVGDRFRCSRSSGQGDRASARVCRAEW